MTGFILRNLTRGATVVTVLSMLLLAYIVSLTGGLEGWE